MGFSALYIGRGRSSKAPCTFPSIRRCLRRVKRHSYWYVFCLRTYADRRIVDAMANKAKFVKINTTASGRLGGTARAAKLTQTQLQAAARKANKAKWDKYYREHPEKIRPKRKRRKAA